MAPRSPMVTGSEESWTHSGRKPAANPGNQIKPQILICILKSSSKSLTSAGRSSCSAPVGPTGGSRQ